MRSLRCTVERRVRVCGQQQMTGEWVQREGACVYIARRTPHAMHRKASPRLASPRRDVILFTDIWRNNRNRCPSFPPPLHAATRSSSARMHVLGLLAAWDRQIAQKGDFIASARVTNVRQYCSHSCTEQCSEWTHAGATRSANGGCGGAHRHFPGGRLHEGLLQRALPVQ